MKPAYRAPTAEREAGVITPFRPPPPKRPPTWTESSGGRSRESFRSNSLADKLQRLALEAPEVARHIERIVEGALEELGLTKFDSSR